MAETAVANETAPHLIEFSGDRPGACAPVTLRRPDGTRLSPPGNGCHGWSVDQCGGFVLLRYGGVVRDEGVVVPPFSSQAVDVPSVINEKLGERAPPDEVLHLRLDRPSCRNDRLAVPFEGSFIGRGQHGSASTLEGIVEIDRNGNHSVKLGAPEGS
jgi:hypothetical protein